MSIVLILFLRVTVVQVLHRIKKIIGFFKLYDFRSWARIFFAMIMMMTDTGLLCTLYKSSVLIDTWQPKGHILARRGHHHVLGVELYASDGSGMVSIEYADFGAIFRIPNVDSAIGGPRDNKLTVGAKRGLQWDRFSVEMTSEGLEYCPGESVDQLDHASIGGNQNGFAVRTELEAGPIDILFCWFAC